MLDAPEPFRTRDIHDDPRFRGWWPTGHPDMRSFLGVPIVAPEGVIGAFYLTEKEGAAAFGAADQELIELLAAHAAIAITERAPVRAQPRAVDALRAQPARARAPRRRSARSSSASCSPPRRPRTLLDRDAAARPARSSSAAGRSRARRSTSCARSSSSCARPTSSATGWRRRCASTSRCCGRCTTSAIDARDRRRGRRRADPAATARSCASPRRRCTTPLRHAGAPRVARPAGGEDGRLVLEVVDDGVGFDPATPSCARATSGLTSMEERAAAAGRRGSRSARPRRRGRPCGWRCPVAERRSASCSSTTTRSSARACARSSSSRTASRSSARPPTASRRVAEAERAGARRRPHGPRDARLDGVGAMRELRAPLPGARVIVLTSFARRRAPAAGDPGRGGGLPAQERRAGRARPRRPRWRTAARRCSTPSVAARLVDALAQPPARAATERADAARARGARPDRPRASRTSGSRASSASPRRRSRPTSATCWRSSA